MSGVDALEAALASACHAHFGEGAELVSLHRLTGGASQETWAFDVVLPEGARRSCILRKDHPGPRYGLDRSTELAVLRAALAAGVTVPAPLFFLADAGGGAGYVMDRIEGETIPPKIFRDATLADACAGMVERVGQELARIHAIDPDVVPDLPRPDPGERPAAQQLRRARATFDSFGEAHPALELGFRWLAEHEPPCERQTVVHGDFRTGNLIVGPDGLRAVLDWELAHVGDPMEDLGWFCVRSWRFGRDARPAGGFGSREALFDAYGRVSGRAVDPEVVRYWEVFGNLYWAVICMMQAAAWDRGDGLSVELAAIGRRTCEAEWDLLELIG